MASKKDIVKEDIISNSPVFLEDTLGAIENAIKDSVKTPETVVAATQETVQQTGNIEIDKLLSTDAPALYIEAPVYYSNLLKNQKNKVLFEFLRPYAIANFDLSTLDENVRNNLQPTKINLYRTTTPPTSLDQMFNPNNLYKILDVEKNQLMFEDELQTDTDYYFAASVYSPEGSTALLLVSLIIFLLGGTTEEVLQIFSTTPIQKINVTKDNDFYSLSREIIDIRSLVDKMSVQKFTNKIFINPRFNDFAIDGTMPDIIKKLNKPFMAGNPVFDSATDSSYVKFRITSKKTNKKIDLNLKNTFLQTDQNFDNKDVMLASAYESKKLNIEVQAVYVKDFTKYIQDNKSANYKNYLEAYNNAYDFIISQASQIIDEFVSQSGIFVRYDISDQKISIISSPHGISEVKKGLMKIANSSQVFDPNNPFLSNKNAQSQTKYQISIIEQLFTNTITKLFQ